MADLEDVPATAGAAVESIAAPPAPSAPSAIADEIDRWFAAEIHNSPASRSVEVINHLRGAVDRLKGRLEALA